MLFIRFLSSSILIINNYTSKNNRLNFIRRPNLNRQKQQCAHFGKRTINIYPLNETEPQPRASRISSPKSQSRRLHKSNAFTQFVPPSNFYNNEIVADARDKYEKYLNILTRRYDNPLE
jgi:hypothetical protein